LSCNNLVHIFSFVVRQPISRLGHLFRLLDRTHTHTHTHTHIHARTYTIGLL